MKKHDEIKQEVRALIYELAEDTLLWIQQGGAFGLFLNTNTGDVAYDERIDTLRFIDDAWQPLYTVSSGFNLGDVEGSTLEEIRYTLNFFLFENYALDEALEEIDAQ